MVIADSSHSGSTARQLIVPDISPVIEEIIFLVLNEKDDVGEIRTTAMRLLVALSYAPCAAADEKSKATATSMNNPVVEQITPLVTRFMSLLENEKLRPFVVKLLSLIAMEATGMWGSAPELDNMLTFATVRRTISLQIISLVFRTDDVSLQGHTELLARLISDGMS